MYHRVCERSTETDCYFERGTAVTPDAFRAQLAWLAKRYGFRTVRELLFCPPLDRPTIALTFDDGYRDVLEHVLPVCRSLGAPATVYTSSATVGTRALLWFDRYYALVPRLRERMSTSSIRKLIAEEVGAQDAESNLRWWVRGPLKDRLRALDPERRDELLERLTVAAQQDRGSPPIKYLDRDDLLTMIDVGWEIGGHVATHERLTDLSPQRRLAELEASAALLADVRASQPWTFAYPDGAVDDAVALATANAGFAAAVTVDAGRFDRLGAKSRLPRLLCRTESEMPNASLLA